MGGTWPNLDASDLETRVRTYLNEATADFYAQAEIWRWLSIGAKDIAQKTLCIRRVLDAVTTASTRNVTVNAYKVLHVEYIPSSGRSRMLTKIDPLRVGNYPNVTPGTEGTPLYWYEFGGSIGIDPIPAAGYNLRLYVADLPKMQHSTFPLTNFSSGWTSAGTGAWANDATDASFSGTTGQSATNTWGTALVASTNYTITLTVSSLSAATLTVKAGNVDSGVTISSNGVHTVTITTSNTDSIVLTGASTGTGTINVDNIYLLKEADFAATSDQTELPTAWQHLLALYSAHKGLLKDKKYGPAQMLEQIYRNEFDYLRQVIVEVIPDGRSALKYS